MNFCSSCGKPLGEQALFCGNCGVAIATPNVTETDLALQEAAVGVIKMGRRSLTRLTVSIAVGAIVVCAAAWFTYQTFAVKSPMQLYLLSEYHSAQHQTKQVEASFASELALQQKQILEPSTTKSELGFDVTYSATDELKSFDTFRQTLQDSKLTLLAQRDPVQQLGIYTLNYLVKGNSLMEATFAHNKESMGLEIPTLYDKMLYLNNSELDKLMDNKATTSKQEDTNHLALQNIKNLFSLTPQQQQRLIKEYSKFIMDNLHEEYFTLTKNVDYSTPDGVKQLSRIDITLTEEQFQQLLVHLIDQVRTDKELQTILAEKYVDMNLLAKQSGYSDENTDLDYAIEQIEDGLYELRKEVMNYEFPEGLHITAWIDSNERIVDRKIDFKIEQHASNNGIAVKIHSSQWESKNNKQTGSFDLALTSTIGANSAIQYHSETVGTASKTGDKKDTKTTLTIDDSGERVLDLGLDLTVFQAADDQEGEENTVYEFELRMDGNDNLYSTYQPVIKGKLTRSIDQNLVKDYANQSYILELVISGNNPLDDNKLDFGIKLDLNNKVTFNDKELIKEPVIKKDGRNVTEMTSDDWDQFSSELYDSLIEFSDKNQGIFDLPGMFY